MVAKFIQPKHGCVLRVTQVHEIIHPEIHHDWAEARALLVNPIAEYRELFHGTGKEGIEGITKGTYFPSTPPSLFILILDQMGFFCHKQTKLDPQCLVEECTLQLIQPRARRRYT